MAKSKRQRNTMTKWGLKYLMWLATQYEEVMEQISTAVSFHKSRKKPFPAKLILSLTKKIREDDPVGAAPTPLRPEMFMETELYLHVISLGEVEGDEVVLPDLAFAVRNWQAHAQRSYMYEVLDNVWAYLEMLEGSDNRERLSDRMYDIVGEILDRWRKEKEYVYSPDADPVKVFKLYKPYVSSAYVPYKSTSDT